MSLGFVDKDFIDEGPNRIVLYDLEIDAALMQNVKIWFSTLDQKTTWYLGSAIEKTIEGEDVFVFNVDTRRAQQLLPDNTLMSTTENGQEVPTYDRLTPNRKYSVITTFTSEIITDIRAVCGRAEITVLEAGPIL